MYDPVVLSKKTEHLVADGAKKKYYRFRPTRFYGGIATADTVGCNLRCTFCWSGNSVWNPQRTGEFYSSEEIARVLQDIAREKSYQQVRVSGGEPTIGRGHLLRLLESIDPKFLFILETNGILLGIDKAYVEELSIFKNLHVRVCLKGCSTEEFSWLTGAKRGFELQLQALENLRDVNLSFNVALVSVKGDKQELFNQLADMGLGDRMIEEEAIKLYPRVKKRLSRAGILDYFY